MRKILTGKFALITSIATLGLYAFTNIKNSIPIVWDLKKLEERHLPPPDTAASITFAPASYYYALPEHTIYKTYPVYVREFERKGYLDSLRKLEPIVAFDPAKLKTKQDWIRAGRIVFNWPVAYSVVKDSVSSLTLKDFDESSKKITRDGRYLFYQYAVLPNGKLLRGSLSCASCHTRLTVDGKVIEGAQGNLFNNKKFAQAVKQGNVPFPMIAEGTRKLYFTPWAPPSHRMIATTPEDFAQTLEAAVGGVSHRQGGTYQQPLKVPSLFGIKDLRYLDHTGLMENRDISDLMRYAALNQGMDMLTSYSGFIPGGKNNNSQLPDVSDWNHPFGYAAKRYTDEQLYALAQYIYSLEAPENPNKPSRTLITTGSHIFKKAGCVSCHTPPLYTNNKLTPVNGFIPPISHFRKYDIFNISIDTDSVNALYTRRGTGYYKIPSLRNIWLQDAFLHNGQVHTLEDLFNADRLHRPANQVKGHPFGLDLTDADKEALIAFLKSL